MGIVPYVYISYDLLQFFFIFFHFFHNFFLLFIIMFAKIALIVGLMICASINTEAKRSAPRRTVSLNEKYLIRIIDRKLDRIPKTIAILKKGYPEFNGSWEEVEAEIKAEYNSLKKKET